MDEEKYFSFLSIRARMAIAIDCLRNALTAERIAVEPINKVLKRLADFTHSEKLDEWETAIIEVAPYTLLDTHPDNKLNEYETLTLDEATVLKNLYKLLPPPIIELLDESIEIGTSNLYGGTGERSEASLKHLLNVIKLMRANQYPVSELQKYNFSLFSQEFGWGDSFDYLF